MRFFKEHQKGTHIPPQIPLIDFSLSLFFLNKHKQYMLQTTQIKQNKQKREKGENFDVSNKIIQKKNRPKTGQHTLPT